MIPSKADWLREEFAAIDFREDEVDVLAAGTCRVSHRGSGQARGDEGEHMAVTGSASERSGSGDLSGQAAAPVRPAAVSGIVMMHAIELARAILS